MEYSPSQINSYSWNPIQTRKIIIHIIIMMLSVVGRESPRLSNGAFARFDRLILTPGQKAAVQIIEQWGLHRALYLHDMRA